MLCLLLSINIIYYTEIHFFPAEYLSFPYFQCQTCTDISLPSTNKRTRRTNKSHSKKKNINKVLQQVSDPHQYYIANTCNYYLVIRYTNNMQHIIGWIILITSTIFLQVVQETVQPKGNAHKSWAKCVIIVAICNIVMYLYISEMFLFCV